MSSIKRLRRRDAGVFFFLTLALKKQIGVIYAIWSGVGTALLAIIGVLYGLSHRFGQLPKSPV